ncbi:YwqG family protein [Okeania sp. SIO2B3]|uniref:YwqG family protein n=1 Tax=Okeania sp. SIO2B3 TaxID=2607784 RepID=UPI0013C01D3E|nr:DUF1963 domain-containing protein [Okeania sp. SIO2B3]NET45515.1 DUF1963 domain-containing protein [Okeania sp. SIO2B3]
MKSSLDINLPEELEPYHEAIANSIKPYLKIDIQPNSTQWWQSKFGGLTYLPRTIDYPTNKKGEYLKLLAQLNFSKIPQLENFPAQGILQFYIDAHDIYGLDYSDQTNQDGFRIIYFDQIVEDVNNLVTDFDFLEEYQETTFGSPVEGEFSLSFIHSYAPINILDGAFGRHFPNFNRDFLDIYDEWYCQCLLIDESVHQVGGNPSFIQGYLRYCYPEHEDYILLLQINSDYDDEIHNICWGDVGIGNFFIKPSQLKVLDFSQVLYNWGCH